MEAIPELVEDEKSAISAYKEYAEKHLPEINKLSDLVVMNFDESAYPKTELIDAFRKYLDDLQPYCKVIREAARLRQVHYEHFILDKKEEDPGHRLWREGFNEIVKDAEEKLVYWTEIHEKLFKKLIDQVEKQPENLERLNLYARKIQPFFYARAQEEKPSKEKTKIVRYKRPVLSKAQKVALKNAAQQQRKFRRELDEKAIAEARKLANTEWKRITGNCTTYDMNQIAVELAKNTFFFDYSDAGKLVGKIKLVGSEIAFKDCASRLTQHFYHRSTLEESTQRTRDLWELFLSLSSDNTFVSEYISITEQLFLEGHFKVDRFRSCHYHCSLAFAEILRRVGFDYRSLTMTEIGMLDMVRPGEEKNYENFIEMYCTILVNGACLTRMLRLNQYLAASSDEMQIAALALSKSKKYPTDVKLVHAGKTYKTDRYLLREVKAMEAMIKPPPSKRGKRR